MRRVTSRKGGAVTVTEMQLRRGTWGGGSSSTATGTRKIVAIFDSDSDFTDDSGRVYIQYTHGLDKVTFSLTNTNSGADVFPDAFTDTGGILKLWFNGTTTTWKQNLTLTMVG